MTGDSWREMSWGGWVGPSVANGTYFLEPHVCPCGKEGASPGEGFVWYVFHLPSAPWTPLEKGRSGTLEQAQSDSEEAARTMDVYARLAEAGACGGDSMAVQREEERARDKLGFTNEAVAFEVLR